MRMIVPPVPGLIEPAPAFEFTFHDIGSIEFDGQYIRLSYYANEMPLYGGDVQHVIKAWSRRPLSATPTILSKLAAVNEFLNGDAATPPPSKPYLVR